MAGERRISHFLIHGKLYDICVCAAFQLYNDLTSRPQLAPSQICSTIKIPPVSTIVLFTPRMWSSNHSILDLVACIVFNLVRTSRPNLVFPSN